MRLSAMVVLFSFAACAPRPDTPPEPPPPMVVDSPYSDNFKPLGRYTRDGIPGPTFVEILDVEVHGDWLYVCAATKGLLKIDLTDPEYPIVAAAKPEAGAVRCQHVEGDGERVVIANRGDEFSPMSHITVFDNTIFPPEAIEVAAITSTTLSYEGLEVLSPGRYAVAMHADGVAIMSVDGETLTEEQRIDGFSNAWDLALSGNHLYVADGFDGVRVIDVAAGAVVGHTPLDGSTLHVEVGDDLLFASSGATGVHVMSLDEPASPEVIATIDTPGAALMSAYADGHLYVAAWNDVRVYDVSDPRVPVRVAIEKIDVIRYSRVLALDARDDRAYLGEWSGLYAYVLSEPTEAPDIALDTYGLNFPSDERGQESARSLIVTNEGDAPLEIVGIEHPKQFVPLKQKVTIAPGDRAAIEFRFLPDDENELVDVIRLLSDDPDEGAIDLWVKGNGYGIGVGDPIPDYEWINLQDGMPISMQGLRGNVVVLSYFATF